MIETTKPSATLALLAYQRLREDITLGILEPGARLRVAELHDRYDFGLSPLREALNRLCADGLVTKMERRGFAVSELSEKEFLDITNSRLVAEEAALRLSFQHGGDDWEERILIAFHRLSKVRDDEGNGDFMLTRDWAVCHQDFHFALLSACGNDWLLGFCKSLYEQSTRYRLRRRQLSRNKPPWLGDLIREHRDILDACLAHDVERAIDLLVAHYRRSVEIVLAVETELHDNPKRLSVRGPQTWS